MATQPRFPEEPERFFNPSPAELKELVAAMPNARWTSFGNLNTKIKTKARSKASTYIVTDNPDLATDQCISKEEGRRIAELQDRYIESQDMIIVDGFIGSDPWFRTPVRLSIEKSNANIAAMQQQLYYTDDPAVGQPDFKPELTVIYTPNLKAEGYPNDRIITVDLDAGVTRVLNSDYFGEAKKGGLRMWNKIVYDRGGLALHAGCKIIPVDGRSRVGLIVGLSGTGKTTTTFTRQNESQPVQDDFVALMPNGRIYTSEDGCFAKTYGLDPEHEPVIYKAVTDASSYLENVSQDENGKVDFFDDTYTQNGRATFNLDKIGMAADPNTIDHASFLLLLNRNDNIIPAVARLKGAQAAAYFMLGETRGTSAGGVEEAGKSLRVPGTNPFFPLRHGLQGNRFLEILEQSRMEVYLMNTGRIGGSDGDPSSRKIKIHHSSAIVKAIAEGTIEWERDPDFGYDIAKHVPGIEAADQSLLNPWHLYVKDGRQEEYLNLVAIFKTDREAHLRKYPALDEVIVQAVRG
ncbi:MAG: phosphoenolpyruvate carboxykinase [Candidatus Eisenbacteria bacterium]|uniref:phosphoenolpyruvate carboxykinase (ATP) n=1 Tax=Eiseniibacteriota bacterium TaxID=2212470 RepID=A0A948WCH8_UNCEI|nr:phosphoenolpyruvate carboxykinase [Candidatus Eisenbacteria bacterium]MBU1950527.1 phosphoenolpyruvate carboxykinase [Candidatus Eisenbacteria bacterium]MBU2690938.1 phosphoenolpyruvate carboxykinase [Candidatus Eisenbacteria bacterium]